MKLESQTGVRIKIVEKTGIKLVDILHKSDPWKGMNCRRENCLLCKTKKLTEKNTNQDCTQRCITYETWCLTCEAREREKISEEYVEEEEDERKRRLSKVKHSIVCKNGGWNTSGIGKS